MTESLPLKVLIVGGGVSGLLMAILLERAGKDYIVIEKQKTFKPSSRSVCLSAVILPVLEQLGLLEDICEVAKPVGTFTVVSHKLDKIGDLSLKSFEERYGYATLILPRPSFYNILLSRIPKEKIVLGRRVLSISQSANGVLVRCSDGTNYSGDILVGADGGNSAIRQNLYKHIEASEGNNILYPQYHNSGNSLHKRVSSNQLQMTLTNHSGKEDSFTVKPSSSAQPSTHKSSLFSCPNHAKKAKFLPESDIEPMEYDSFNISGLTDQLSVLPEINESDFTIVVGKDKRYSIWLMPMVDRRLSWSINLDLDCKKGTKDQEEAFKLSDYGPESVGEVCNLFRDHMSPVPGLTLGDIFDQSPSHLIQRTILQQKVYETWYGGRVVLVGDACHKFVLAAGQGDITNIGDCVCLANFLHDLRSNTLVDIQAVFEAYRKERYPVARKALSISRQMQSLFVSNGIVAAIVRKFTFMRGVDFVYRKLNDMIHARRMLVTYIAYPQQRGVFKRIDPIPSPRQMDHLPVFNSYAATKAYISKVSEVMHSNNQQQPLPSEEARRKQQQQDNENRLYHYHHYYRQPISSSSLLHRSEGSTVQDELPPLQMGDYYALHEPTGSSSRSSSAHSRELGQLVSQISSSRSSYS